MNNLILKNIRDFEKRNKIRIIFAVESGSREWGFASDDSDYDIRCVHISSINDYLSLNQPKEQLEEIKDNIDIVSWDIHKFFNLLLKSNPTVSEWLSSKKSYISNKFWKYHRKDILKIFNNGFSRNKLKIHYSSLAKQNYSKYINLPDKVLLKKYVYILRALGCIEFIEKTNSLPPLNWKLSSKYLPNPIKKIFAQMVNQKKSSESNKGNRNEILDRWIEQKLNLKYWEDEANFDTKFINQIVIKTIKKYSKF